MGLAVHCGSHTQDYVRYVYRSIRDAKSEADVVNTLSRIREELLHGDRTLNYLGNL